MHLKYSVAFAALVAFAFCTPASAGGLSGLGAVTGAVSAVGSAVASAAGVATAGTTSSQSNGMSSTHGFGKDGFHGKKILKHVLHYKKDHDKKNCDPEPPMRAPPVLAAQGEPRGTAPSCSAEQLASGMCYLPD